ADGALNKAEFRRGQPAAKKIHRKQQHPGTDVERTLGRGRIHFVAEQELEVSEAVVATESEVVAEEHQGRCVGERLAENRKIDALDARAECQPPENEGDDGRHEDDHRSSEAETLERNPVRRQAARFGEAFVEFEEDHEVGQVALVLAELPDLQHEIHAESVSAEREEQALTETEQAGVTPKQVHAQCQHGVAEIFAVNAECESRDVKRRSGGHEAVKAGQDNEPDESEDGDEQQFAFGKRARHPSRLRLRVTNKPAGRHWRNRIMAASTVILPITAPNQGWRIWSVTPTPIDAETVPATLPTPPSTTIMKQSTM